MEKSKEEFVVFIRQAVNDRKSESFIELYQFLVQCFVRADKFRDGLVTKANFDSMIEEAAALPRLHGFAPTSASMYPSESARKSARAEMFEKMDTNNSGTITLEEWVNFAMEHIMGKVATLPKDVLGGSSDDVTKEEFIDFMQKAVDKSTPEYEELYFFLLKCFAEADKDRNGSVQPEEFDAMIEIAAAAPRRFGLAPSSSAMFKTDAERLAKRKEYFDNMDTNGDNSISFDEWLDYAFTHIVGKVAQMGF